MKLTVIDLTETGRQIGEKLFVHLTATQKKELAQYVLATEKDYGASNNLSYVNISDKVYQKQQDIGDSLTEIRLGNLYFCLEHRMVKVREKIVHLTVKEFDLFALLILHPKRVFTYEMLMDLVWHEDYTFYSRKAVNNHVSNLRKKLKISPNIPDYVKSVYGVGYKFEI